RGRTPGAILAAGIAWQQCPISTRTGPRSCWPASSRPDDVAPRALASAMLSRVVARPPDRATGPDRRSPLPHAQGRPAVSPRGVVRRPRHNCGDIVVLTDRREACISLPRRPGGGEDAQDAARAARSPLLFRRRLPAAPAGDVPALGGGARCVGAPL